MAAIAGPYIAARTAPTESAPLAGLMRAGAICALLQSAWLLVQLVTTFGFARPLNFVGALGDPASEIAALHSGAGVLVPLATLLAVASALFVPATLAIAEYLRPRSPSLVGVASAFGFLGGASLLLGQGITATLVSESQRAPDSVLLQQLPAVALGGSTTVGIGLLCFSLWIGLLSLAILRAGGLPHWFAYLGLLTALVDLAILVAPPIGVIPTVMWFAALGGLLLSRPADILPGAQA